MQMTSFLQEKQLTIALNGEIDHDKKRNLTVGKPERVLHRQKKQRHKVVDDRLNKIADIACVKGVFKIISDSH